MRSFLIMLAIAATASLAGCASDEEFSRLPPETGHVAVEAGPAKPLQCVPYAREHSEVKIYGDAWTWWSSADGLYDRGHAPRIGAVVVFNIASRSTIAYFEDNGVLCLKFPASISDIRRACASVAIREMPAR